MTAIDMLTAISGTKSLAVLDGVARNLWADWADGKLSDDQAASLAETLELRKREVRGVDTVAAGAPQVTAAAKAQGRPSYFPPKRKGPVCQIRRVSIERRRMLAASGPMPPALACLFTTGELAALRIVADEARDRKQCRLTLGEIAARAGVGITTARNALRYAAREGLVTIEERPPNLANVVRIVSREWTGWIERGRKMKTRVFASEGGGCKKAEATDKASSRSFCGERASRAQHAPFIPRRPPKGGALDQAR
jgi:Bacterial regulatory proteins, gntR family